MGPFLYHPLFLHLLQQACHLRLVAARQLCDELWCGRILCVDQLQHLVMEGAKGDLLCPEMLRQGDPVVIEDPEETV
ncbi:hypothetical protein D3C75_1150410 [compost metagenome]